MKGLTLLVAIIITLGFASCSSDPGYCVACTNESQLIPCKACVDSSGNEVARACDDSTGEYGYFVYQCEGPSGSFHGTAIDTTDAALINTNNCYDERDFATNEKATKEAVGQTCTITED